MEEKIHQQEVEAPAQASKTSENTSEQKQFSQEKLDEIVQKRLREQKASFERQQETAIKQALEDFQRKSQLSAEELKNEEFEEQRRQLENEREAFENERRLFDLKHQLNQAGISGEIAGFFKAGAPEENAVLVSKMKESFDAEVKAKVQAEIQALTKQTTPQDPVASATSAPSSGIIAR